jgi:hypothetical protein
MANVKKARPGSLLSRRQYKRLGRIEERNPERADRVSDRMIERNTRLERGKALVTKKVADKVAAKLNPADKKKYGGKVVKKAAKKK